MLSRHPASDSLKLHQFVFFWCLSYVKFYLLNFAVAHAQKKIVMLIKVRHNSVALLVHKKLSYHLKQAWKSISNLSNL